MADSVCSRAICGEGGFVVVKDPRDMKEVSSQIVLL